jgi:hypothetical protein
VDKCRDNSNISQEPMRAGEVYNSLRTIIRLQAPARTRKQNAEGVEKGGREGEREGGTKNCGDL